jgi:hypothetical protein
MIGASILIVDYFLAYPPTLKLEAVCSSEIFVYFYQTTRRHIPEDCVLT